MKIVNAFRRSFSVFGGAYSQLWQLRVLVWTSLVMLASLVAYTALFSPQTSAFAFTKMQCVDSFILLPSHQAVSSETRSKVTYKNNVLIAGYPVVSRSVCYDFQSAPAENEPIHTKHALFGFGALAKRVNFSPSTYPKLNTGDIPNTISTAEPLKFGLTTPDSFFDYIIQANQLSAPCVSSGTDIACEVKSLGLEHSKKYEISVTQTFKNTVVGTVANIQAVTANPVILKSDTIPSGSIIYDKPQQIVISSDTALQNVENVTLTSKIGEESAKQVLVTTKLDGQKIVISITEPLPRQAELSLTIGSALSPDGGTLVAPFTAVYKTSGGPRVAGVNIRDRAVSLNQKVVLGLDQALLPGQNVATLYGIKANGVAVPTLVTVNGKTVTITPQSNFAPCTVLQIWAAEGAVNVHGVSGGSAWTFNSRSTCANVFSIGTSVKGRSIIAYKFGSGAETVLFTGNLHGNESNTKRLLDSWIDELEGNPGRIPAGKSIVVIPLTNPDGYASGTRTNASNVDLNRNFAANNWKSTVKMPSGETLATGGGVTALSEPESQALANYVSALGPGLVMSYHSMGNVVVANDAGNSWNLTKTYSAKSGYGAENGATIGNFFDYDTTGAFEDWLHDKKGIAAILVELATRENSEFSRNKNAMWQIVADF